MTVSTIKTLVWQLLSPSWPPAAAVTTGAVPSLNGGYSVVSKSTYIPFNEHSYKAWLCSGSGWCTCKFQLEQSLQQCTSDISEDQRYYSGVHLELGWAGWLLVETTRLICWHSCDIAVPWKHLCSTVVARTVSVVNKTVLLGITCKVGSWNMFGCIFGEKTALEWWLYEDRLGYCRGKRKADPHPESHQGF